MENQDPATPSVSTSLYTTANASTLDSNTTLGSSLGDSILILGSTRNDDESVDREGSTIGTICLDSTGDTNNTSVVEISKTSTPIVPYGTNKKSTKNAGDGSFAVVIDVDSEGFNPSSEEESELDLEDEEGEDDEVAEATRGATAVGQSSIAKLPETVTLLTTPDGGSVYLVGTAHFSKESQEDVAEVIRAVQPHVVLVELCKARVNILQLDEQTILEEAKNINFEKIKSTIQQNGLFHGIMNILLLSMSAHLTKELGMAPGGEFRRAFSEAKQVPHCVVHLGDRPIKLTLQRALASLSWWQTLKLTWHIMSKESIRGSRAMQAAGPARGDAGRADGRVPSLQPRLCGREGPLLGQLPTDGSSAHSLPLLTSRVHPSQGGWCGRDWPCPWDSAALGKGGSRCHPCHHGSSCSIAHKSSAEDHGEGFSTGSPCLGLRAHPAHSSFLQGHRTGCRKFIAHHQGYCARLLSVRGVNVPWSALVQCFATILLSGTLLLVFILVIGFSLVYWVIRGLFLWQVIATHKELSKRRGPCGADQPATVSANVGQLTCVSKRPSCQLTSCGHSRCSSENARGISVQQLLYILEHNVYVVFSLCNRKYYSDCNEHGFLIRAGSFIDSKIGKETLRINLHFDGWMKEKALCTYPYKPYKLLCNVFQSSLYLTYEFYHKLLLYHSFLSFNCYEYSKSLKMAVPCFHSILPGNVTCYVESFPTSRNIGDDVFKSVNCYYSFITSQYFNLKRTLRSLTSPFWGLEGGDMRPSVDCKVWVGVVSEVHGGGAVGDRTPAVGGETRLGGGKEGNVKRENRGLGDGEERCSREEGGATGEVGQSLPNEDECSGLLVDEYEHPSPDLFYVPTNVCGPGVLPEAFDSSYVGCSCSVGSVVCSENGLKCACVARSLGVNYVAGGLLAEEKMSGPWHLPVVECGETCGCSAGCGNRRVQFGPLATLQVFETAAEGEGGVVEESVRRRGEKPRSRSGRSEPSSQMSKGLGLRTLAFVPRGSFVCEYAGEVIGRDEAMRRWSRDSSEGQGNYILALVESNEKISNTSMAPTGSSEKFATEGKVEERVPGDKNYQVATYIDPTRIGNIGRYANHSCNPNCMTISVRFQGTVPHLCLFAARDICPGEEVTFDYAGVYKGESVGCVCNEEKINSPSFGQKRKSSELDGVCTKDMAEKRCNVSNKSQVLEQVHEKQVGRREVRSESHNCCDKLAEYCSSESQVCLKVSGLSQCKDEQPGTSQIHHERISDSEKASKHCEMMLVESRHENEMTRTLCLCQDKNCRKFLPFTELWI